MTKDQIDSIVQRFISFLETGNVAANLFTSDVFCDFTLPRWRVQAQGLEPVVGLRKQGHPGPSNVVKWHCEPTPNGFVIEFEERWSHNGQNWYCREIAVAQLKDDAISSLNVYCTGDWDAAQEAQHAKAVSLIKP